MAPRGPWHRHAAESMVKAAWLGCVLGLAACSQAPAPAVPCADLQQGCRAAGVEVRTDAPPSALRPFTLTVEAPGAREVVAEFVMVGMDMGLNRYRLQPVASSRFEARVALPVCVSGRRDWVLWLSINGRRVGFAFQTR